MREGDFWKSQTPRVPVNFINPKKLVEKIKMKSKNGGGFQIFARIGHRQDFPWPIRK